MTLRFPSQDALELALRAGLIPGDVADEPVVAAFEPGGAVRVTAGRPVPRAKGRALADLGVVAGAPVAADEPGRVEAACWPQLVPCRRAAAAETVGATTPVLFDLPGALVPELAGEILRLGNDRQSIRWLSTGDEAPARALLRVVGPPYYALLRALDRRADDAGAPRAFVERAPRVWVEIGHEYPWADRLRLPAGASLLIRAPRDWERIDDAPFRDLYESVEFDLPTAPAAWSEAPEGPRFRVPLRLGRGSVNESPDLWVVSGDGAGRLDDLVRAADDRLLARLAFAVGESSGRTVVVLRVRPSKLPPPVLVLDALACRSYLRLPNLFLPVGTRLRPPLRRDAVARLLADDPARITWLTPLGGGDFRAESLPDDAFRPLDQWVDYVLDREHEALAAWSAASRFEFEPFVCRDEGGDRPSGPRREASAPKERPAPAPADEPKESRLVRILRRRSKGDPMTAPEVAAVEPGDAVRRLTALEAEFEGLQGPLDHPERPPLWAEMAGLNAALERHADAAVCWANARWELADPPSGWADDWWRAEAANCGLSLDDGAALDALLADPKPGVAELRALAARLVAVAASGDAAASAPLVARSSRLQAFVEQNESLLPTRVAWLAWASIASLAGGDVLALARARDRILERLHQGGLNRELDLPSFLRHGAGLQGERARVAAAELETLHAQARTWVGRGAFTAPHTGALTDLVFAFGLARSGNAAAARSLLARGLDDLPRGDDVTHWLGRAYDFRIRQALEGGQGTGPLPVDLMRPLDAMGRDGTEDRRKQEKNSRYKIDRLREHSTILEPHERVSPYRHWHGSQTDEVARDLARVVDLTDRAEMKSLMDRLLAHRPPGPKPAVREGEIVGTALEVAFRLGDAFARGLFGRVIPAVDGLDQLHRRARLLERAIPLAAHYDQPGHVRAYVARFEGLLAGVTPRDHKELEPVLRSCFKGLRKLGLRDAIDRLLDRMTEAVLRRAGGEAVENLSALAVREGPKAASWSQALRLLLHVAAGRCYFGQPDRALPVFDEARALLLIGALPPLDQTALACGYARALGQAPTEIALPRLRELFGALTRVHDTFTVGSHYSLSRLNLVEAVVLTLASEEFTMGESGLRWIEDDEYLIRRRIHRDVRAALGESA